MGPVGPEPPRATAGAGPAGPDPPRDGFRESIIRLGVKVDNGLEKLNQGLKKAEKEKNSDQTSGSNLRARYTLTTARGAR
jgi:hypothetical protein